jgi:hypothetical protein
MPAISNRIGHRLLCLALLSAAVASCGPRVPVRNYSDPAEFARNLFRIAEEGDGGEKEWATQLTAERRAMGQEYVAKHFAAWKKTLQELAKSFGKPVDQVTFRVTDDNRLEFEFDNKWYLLIHVTQENGAYRINQD